jgi:hypothetical protein
VTGIRGIVHDCPDRRPRFLPSPDRRSGLRTPSPGGVLAELDRELAAAVTAADAKRARRLERERGALGAELERASGPGHRSRPLGASTVERAGKAVTARIRDAIRLIEAVIPSSVRA